MKKRDRPQRAKENLLNLRNPSRPRELSNSESSKKLDRKHSESRQKLGRKQEKKPGAS